MYYLDLSLVKKYFYPKTILDIGAHTGEFNLTCQQQFPGSHILSIEGNELCEPALKQITSNYRILLLGSENKKVIFYRTKNNPANTGDSIYKELTDNYNNDSVVKVEKELKTLSSCLSNPFLAFDLIKIDTQGSEIDILKGGEYLAQRAKGILLEVSMVPYNEGAPLKDEIVEYMKSINFKVAEIINTDTAVQQQDILFINEN